MADLLVAVLDGPARLGPDAIVEPARAAWPHSPQSPPADRFAANTMLSLELHDAGPILFVDFLGVHEGLGLDGDDDLAAAFLAWLSNLVDVRGSRVVVSDWADDLVTLVPRMSAHDVARLRMC